MSGACQPRTNETVFTVIPLGYENIIPEVAQYQYKIKDKTALDNLRNTPDYVLISQGKEEVYFVEVKYRKNFTGTEISAEANEIYQKWNNAYMFIATNDTFYFDKCEEIVKKKGNVNKLDTLIIDEEIQQKYLAFLNEFLH